MLKNILIALALLFSNSFVSLYAQTHTFEWAKRTGGTTSILPYSITTDLNENIYTTGGFTNTADFDPGSLIFNLTSVGSGDIFIQKLNSNGDFLWAKSFGTINRDEGISIKTDEFGNVYIIGAFNGTADFDPGIGVFNLSTLGLDDVFIQKLDSNGNFLWAKQIGSNSIDRPKSLNIDSQGNLVISGTFVNTIDADPGAGIFNLTSRNPNSFILKLDNNGNFIWAKQISGSDNYIRSTAIDANGYIYNVGEFIDTADFDPSNGIFNLITPIRSYNSFIQKLDSNGNFVWVKQLRTFGISIGHSISLDKNGDIITTGIFNGIGDFDPGSGIFNISALGLDDIYILKLDSAGNFLWANNFGGNSSSSYRDFNHFITTDKDANIYSIGHFHNTVDFDPSNASFNITSNGVEDIFIQKLDSAGNFLWVKQMGGPNIDIGIALILTKNGEIITTGSFQNTVDFNPGIGVFNLTSAFISDMFVQKLRNLSTGEWYNINHKIYFIYPNPASNQLFINSEEREIIQFRIIDLVGRVVVEVQDLNTGINQIDVSSLENGIYLTQIEKDEAFYTEKLVISK